MSSLEKMKKAAARITRCCLGGPEGADIPETARCSHIHGMKVEWLSHNEFQLGDLKFRLSVFDGRSTSAGTTFILKKDRTFLDYYDELLREERVESLLEFGIYEGGSTLLFHRAFGVQKIVGVDLRPPVAALEDYLGKSGLEKAIRCYFNTNQADSAAVTGIIGREFGERPIDLIVDDASHFLEETRVTFDIAFPYLKQGGYYVIEDWAWWFTALADHPGWKGRPALANLALELVLAAGTLGNSIEQLVVNSHFLAVRKGPAPAAPGSFSLSDTYDLRGKKLNLL